MSPDNMHPQTIMQIKPEEGESTERESQRRTAEG